VERSAEIGMVRWRAGRSTKRATGRARASMRTFALLVIGCACVSAFLSTWLPLQVSIITVFLFAGPHNWFELRYFLSRLPLRFGRSRNFFVVAFAGIGFLTLTYLSLPVLYYANYWSGANWPTAIAFWNTLLLLWIASLVWLRGKQRLRRDWGWAWAAAFGLGAVNWLAPEMFSLAIVYAHPLVALWFLDRHLRRTRPDWLPVYRRCLALLPLLLAGMFWQLSHSPSLPDDNGLAWRITQHAGAQLLPGVSTHLLVSTHVFLEMLHYGVWLLALPLIGARGAPWNLQAVPLVRHPRGFPKLIVAVLGFAFLLVLLLWGGFSFNYAATRDIYFAVAIAHVLAEAPFLLRMM
jgi:hypothetical protein